MNKKILIASIFVTLILTVPMTSVVGVSDVNDNCGCQIVNRNNQVSSFICDILVSIWNQIKNTPIFGIIAGFFWFLGLIFNCHLEPVPS